MGRLPFLDVMGLGIGYKLITHDCDTDDVEAMLDDLALIPSLIRPAASRPEPPEMSW